MNDGRSEYLSHGAVTLYTKASFQRADDLLSGRINNNEHNPRSNITRWISEIILQETMPDNLKALGISRKQPIFSTPVPFQGATPGIDKVLLAFETDSSQAYVAEGDFLTQMREFGVVDMGVLMQLKQQIGRSRDVTFEDVFKLYTSLSSENKKLIIDGITPLAQNYWNSVVPYDEYIKTSNSYIESEVLLLPQAPIINIRKK